MAEEIERLLVKLEADTSDMRRKLDGVEKQVANYEKKTRRSYEGAGKAAQKHGLDVEGAFKRVAAGYLAYLSVANATAALNAASSIERDAKSAGLAADEFQELAFAMQTIGVRQDQFLGSAGQFASQMGELRAETGGFYEFLRNHLPTVLDQVKATRNVAEAYEVVADAARDMRSEEERTILIAKAFGEEGRKMSQLFAEGATGIRAARQEARELGVVLDQDMLTAAGKVQREFDVFAMILDTRFKQAVIATHEVLSPLADLMGEAFSNAASHDIQHLGLTGSESLGQLEHALASLQHKLSEVQASAVKPVSEQSWFEQLAFWADSAEDQTGRLAERIREVSGAIEQLQKTDGAGEKGLLQTISGAAAGMSMPGGLALRKKQEAIPAFRTEVDTEAVQAFRRLEAERLSILDDSLSIIRMNYADELGEFQRMLDEKKITEEEFSEARTKLNEIAEADITAHMMEQRARSSAELSELSSLIESSLSQPLSDAFNGGMQSADVYFTRMLAGFGEIITQALVIKPLVEGITGAIGGSGGGSNFLSGLLGGARAAGGPVLGSAPYLVGERGPEIVVPNSSGRVLPNGQGVGGSSSVTYNIDARGADVGVEARIAATIARIEKQRQSPLRQIGDARRRYPTRG